MQLEDRKPAGTAELLGRDEPKQESPRATGQAPGSLLPEREASSFQDRWTTCQSRFVDDPRNSVQEADQLVAELMQNLARQFADTRQSLEKQWSEGSDASTEDLRLALQRYRDFFNRLLTV